MPRRYGRGTVPLRVYVTPATRAALEHLVPVGRRSELAERALRQELAVVATARGLGALPGEQLAAIAGLLRWLAVEVDRHSERWGDRLAELGP